MAIQISGTTVIDDNRRVGAGMSSIYGTVSSTDEGAPLGALSLTNRQLLYVRTTDQDVTLPASPQPGNEVEIIVKTNTGVTVLRNGQNIMGLAENMDIDVPYAPVRLTYIDSTQGWVIS